MSRVRASGYNIHGCLVSTERTMKYWIRNGRVDINVEDREQKTPAAHRESVN